MAYNRSEMRVARIRRDLSQIDMAEMLGITKQAYWRKENGKNVLYGKRRAEGNRQRKGVYVQRRL